MGVEGFRRRPRVGQDPGFWYTGRRRTSRVSVGYDEYETLYVSDWDLP